MSRRATETVFDNGALRVEYDRSREAWLVYTFNSEPAVVLGVADMARFIQAFNAHEGADVIVYQRVRP